MSEGVELSDRFSLNLLRIITHKGYRQFLGVLRPKNAL